MSNSWFLARRLLLWRQERRRLNRSAVLSVVGMAVGSAVLVLSLSILNGFEAEVRESLLRFEHQAVLLPRSSRAEVETAVAALAAAGISTRPYAERKLVVQSEEDYRLVTARIVPDLAAQCAVFSDVIQQQLPTPPVRPGVMIGSLLADKLGLLPGDEVRLISPLDISLADPRPPQLMATVQAVYEFQPHNYEELLSFKGVGPATVRGLALVADLIYGEKPSWKDPVKYSFAYGGKDGVPFPVDRRAMDESIQILRETIQEAKIGDKDKLRSFQRLRRFATKS